MRQIQNLATMASQHQCVDQICPPKNLMKWEFSAVQPFAYFNKIGEEGQQSRAAAPRAVTTKSLQQAGMNRGLNPTATELMPRELTHAKSVHCFTESTVLP